MAERYEARPEGEKGYCWKVSPDGNWACIGKHGHAGRHGPFVGLAPIPQVDIDRAMRELVIPNGWDKIDA
jgi:hypothetical protein